MPSRNSINKPKLVGKQSRKSVIGQHRKAKLTISRAVRAGVVKPEGVIRGRVLSKKQIQKDERNRRYMVQRGLLAPRQDDLETGDDVMTDSAQISRTQLKKEQRSQLFAIEDQAKNTTTDSEMEVTSTGKGTTLGGPPNLS
ncbi:hypothetical protein V1511DRAFT_492569 [Dipodascopsis uninucleata]